MRANIPRRLSTLITKDRASSNPKHKNQLSFYQITGYMMNFHQNLEKV